MNQIQTRDFINSHSSQNAEDSAPFPYSDLIFLENSDIAQKQAERVRAYYRKIFDSAKKETASNPSED